MGQASNDVGLLGSALLESDIELGLVGRTNTMKYWSGNSPQHPKGNQSLTFGVLACLCFFHRPIFLALRNIQIRGEKNST